MSVANIASLCELNCELNLAHIKAEYPDSIYEPKRFNGLRIAIEPPSGKAILFSKGKIVLTGSKGLASNQRLFRKVVRLLRAIGYQPKRPKVKITNIVWCNKLDHRIKMEQMVREVS